jgi:cytolysin-activating lysine-acyltransferase
VHLRDDYVFAARNVSSDEHHVKLGYAAALLASIARRPHMPMPAAIRLLDVAIGFDQFKLYLTGYGRPVAYVAWAFLSHDVEQRITRTKSPLLHVSEWNEGSSLWIMDLVAPHGHLSFVLRDLRDALFREHQTVRYVRMSRQRFVVKKLGRESPASFFTKKTVPALAGPAELPGWRLDAAVTQASDGAGEEPIS